MYERMLNKETKPTIKDLSLYIGTIADLFTEFNTFLSDNYNTEQDIRFPYGNEYGWCITHRKGKKMLCNVFAELEAFTVMIRMSNRQLDSIYETLQPETKQIIDNKYPCSDGGWIHYRVLSKEHLNEIAKLLSIKCS